MTDIAGLVIKVTTSGVKDASTELDKLATSGDKAAKSTDGLNKVFNQGGGIEKPAKAAAQAFNQQTAALAKLAGQIDPTVAKLDKLDKLQEQLGKFKKGGMISADDFTALNGALDASRAKIGSAGEAVHKFSLNNSLARRELGYLAKDLATGQYGRFQQSALTLANASGVMALAFSGIGLAVGGVVASLSVFAIASFKAAAQTDALNKALIATGGYAGKTSDQLEQMSRNMAVGTTSQKDAAAALTEVAASGRFTAAQIGLVAQAAVDMARLTGQSTADTIKQFESLQHAPVEAVLKLNETQHFLTSTIYEQIKALQDQGKEQDAANLAMQTYASNAAAGASKIVESGNLLVQSFHGVRDAAKEAGGWVLKLFNEQTNQDKFDALAARRDRLLASQAGGAKFDVNSGQDIQKMIDATTKAMSAMQDARIKADKSANQKSLADQAVEAQAANDAEVTQYASNADKRNKEKLASAERANQRYAAAMAAGNKKLAEQIAGDQVKIQAGIDAKYKDPKAPASRAAPNFRVQDMAELRKEIEAEGKLMDQRIRSAEAVKAYRASLQDMLATRQATIDLQVASIGMGQREIAQQQALIAIDEDYNRQKSSLERQQRNSTSEIDKAGFAAQLSDLKRYHDDRVKLETEGFALSAAARDNWANGAQAATKDFMDGAKDIAGATYSVVTNIYSGLADNMADFFTKGKADWKGFVADILKQIVRIQTAKAVAGIATSLSGSFGFQGGTSASTFAKGGVFDSPSLSAYSGGVYSSPQPFKFAKGAGVFGEAGPEAIMPLSRGPDGKLGVKASGGGGGGVTLNQTIVVDSKGGSDNTSGTGDDNLRQFAGKMKGIAQQAILDEQRPGGSLWRMGQRA